MDGGRGFVHVPETRPGVLPNHNTLHSYSISHLLVYVVALYIVHYLIKVFILPNSGSIGSSNHSTGN